MRGAARQNFFLYFFGTLFNLGGVLAVMAGSRLTWAAVFRGHSRARARAAGPPARLRGSDRAWRRAWYAASTLGLGTCDIRQLATRRTSGVSVCGPLRRLCAPAGSSAS
jgi:hypothetical protein